MKKISVVIPALNEEGYIEATLRDLANQTFRNFELIVKDGLSTDSTVEIAKKYADIVISERDLCIGDARNQGAKHASGEILAFLDADTSLDKDALMLVSEDFELYNIVLLLPRYGTKEEVAGVMSRTKQQVNRFLVGFENFWRKRIDNFCGGMFMPVDVSAFRRVGGFDRRLQCVEDIELSYRLRRIGDLLVDYRIKAYFSFRRFFLSGYFRTLRNYGLNAIRMLLDLSQPEFEIFR